MVVFFCFFYSKQRQRQKRKRKKEKKHINPHFSISRRAQAVQKKYFFSMANNEKYATQIQFKQNEVKHGDGDDGGTWERNVSLQDKDPLIVKLLDQNNATHDDIWKKREVTLKSGEKEKIKIELQFKQEEDVNFYFSDNNKNRG